jgi:ubiquinone/menaquinone biosynthesis C-methylase UbiE
MSQAASSTLTTSVPITTLEGTAAVNFDRMAGWYDRLATWYSWGRIRQAKLSQIKYIQRGDKVIYCGVGTGEEAIAACKAGAQVTCVDSSRKMLDQLAARLAADGLSAELICGDQFKHRKFGHYDVVVANFFLNCFRDEPMIRALMYLMGLARRNGLLMIADIAPLQGNIFSRMWQWSYNFVGIVPFWMMGLVPMHKVFDYGKICPVIRLKHEKTETFRLLPFGPPAFQSLIVRRADDEAEAATESTKRS